jgi:hypothetical protein
MTFSFRSKVSVIIISLILGQMSGVQEAIARPVKINKLPCMVTSNTGSYWNNDAASEIVLKREIYTSVFDIYVGRDIACKLPAAQDAYLDLQLAIPSNEFGSARIDFYLNGSLVKSLQVEPGKVISAKIPLTGRSEISYAVGGRRTLGIETSCLSSSCGYIRSIRGNLEIRQSPGQ